MSDNLPGDPGLNPPPPAGWLDDPDDPTQLRYWDGSGWTDQRSAKPPVAATRAMWINSPAGEKKPIWKRWWAIAAAALLAIVVIAAIAGSPSEDESEAPDNNAEESEAPDNNAEESEAPDDNAEESEAPDDNAEESGESVEGELTSVGRSGLVWYDALGETWAKIGVEVTNNSDEDLFYQEVTFNVLDSSGTPVATESSYLEVMPAGDTVITDATVTTDLSDSLPVTVEITVFADEDSFFKTEWAYMEIGPDVEISTDEFRPSVTGTLTNPTDQTVDFFPINCLLVDADDNVVTAVSGFGDSTAPGQTIAFELTGAGAVETAVNAGAVSTECISIASLD